MNFIQLSIKELPCLNEITTLKHPLSFILNEVFPKELFKETISPQGKILYKQLQPNLSRRVKQGLPSGLTLRSGKG